jgi:hypothetical protein|tara:strand:+ start:282 stop:533 length:252 start_codon:yes stop_codon:yes gene_type:complete
MNKEIKLNFTIWNELMSALTRQANDYSFMGDEVSKKQWKNNDLAFDYLKSVAKPIYYKKQKEMFEKQVKKTNKFIEKANKKLT